MQILNWMILVQLSKQKQFELNSYMNREERQKMPISAANIQFCCTMSTYYSVIDSSGDLNENSVKKENKNIQFFLEPAAAYVLIFFPLRV